MLTHLLPIHIAPHLFRGDRFSVITYVPADSHVRREATREPPSKRLTDQDGGHGCPPVRKQLRFS